MTVFSFGVTMLTRMTLLALTHVRNGIDSGGIEIHSGEVNTPYIQSTPKLKDYMQILFLSNFTSHNSKPNKCNE